MALQILQIENTCTGCGSCVSSCPKHALSLSYNDEGFYIPHLIQELCVDCKICEKACHVLNVPIRETPSKNFTSYMVKAKNKVVVQNSSSGGAFSLLADSILNDGGVVYGARYNFEEERLEHCSTDSCTLDDLRKSKYIESYLGSIFQDVQSQLQKGRKVLFCGTPCQIEGLSYYLKQKKTDTTELLLVRILCHGVPANKYFTEYKHYEERRFKSKLISFDFRPKTHGWWSIDWKMTFKNGVTEQGPYNNYYYYYYYYLPENLTLRKCCYNCSNILNESADFTIADFWGIKKYRPELKDNDGISLLLAHTRKSEEHLRLISDVCECTRLPQAAVDYIYESALRQKKLFERRLDKSQEIAKEGFMKLAKKEIRQDIIKYRIFEYKDRLINAFLRIF